MHSTPGRTKSSQHDTEFSPASDANGPQHQSRLVKALSAELNMHVWGNDADEIAQMLSPKAFKDDGTRTNLIDHPVVKKTLDALSEDALAWSFDVWGWETARVERDHYTPIASLLNHCVGQCDTMYELLRASGELCNTPDSDFVLGKLKDRFLEDLFFAPYDKNMGDTIEDAAPMKPDLLSFAGGPIFSQEVLKQLKAFWSLAKDKRTIIKRQVAITVEVKWSWKLLVEQIAAYVPRAVCSRTSALFRSWYRREPEDGHNQLLHFHRGGLTMSAPLKIVNKTRKQGKGKKKRASKPAPEQLLRENRRKVLKLMLSMLLWQDAVDAGFPPFTNGLAIILPDPTNDFTFFTVMIGGVLYYALSLRGRNTVVYLVQYIGGKVYLLPPKNLLSVKRQLPRSDSLLGKRKVSEGTLLATGQEHPAKQSRNDDKTPKQDDEASDQTKEENKEETTQPQNDDETPEQDNDKVVQQNDDDIFGQNKIAGKQVAKPTFVLRSANTTPGGVPGPTLVGNVGRLPTRAVAYVDADVTPTYPGRISGLHNFVGPAIVKFSWQPRVKIDLEKRMYEASNNQFGTAKMVTSFVAPWRKNQVMSNELFLVPGGQQRAKIRIKKPTPKVDNVNDDAEEANDEGVAEAGNVDGGAAEPENVDGGAAEPENVDEVAAEMENEGATDDEDMDEGVIVDEGASIAGKVDEEPFGGLDPLFASDIQETMLAQEKILKATNKQDNTSDRDIRVLVVSAFEDVGKGFEHCDSAEDLCFCLLHSMLGWLSTYQGGFLHRDVSIGNLLKLDHPATREEFSIKTAEDFVGALNLVLDSDRGFDSTTPISIPTDCREPVSLKTSELLKSALRFTDPREKMEGYLEIAKESLGIARAVKNVASQLGASTTCKAIISDGDLAAYMPTYFSTQHERGTISGTFEFMSTPARHAYETPEPSPYLQSPVDDMESFFWVALWAALRNKNVDLANLTPEEKRWRKGMRGSTLERSGVAGEIGERQFAISRNKFNPILASMWDVLGQWRKELAEVRADWEEYGMEFNAKASPDNLLHLLHFDVFAYKGVLAFLMALAKNKQGIQSAQPSKE